MARTVQEIYDGLMPKVKEALGIDPSVVISAVSIEGMLVWAFAFAANLVELVFDKVKAEIQAYVDNMKPHTRLWYANRVREFQYGYTIDDETLKYDNTGLTDEQVEASLIIDSVSVIDGDNDLQIKVAKQGASDLEPLDSDELNALESYMARMKDAGVKLNIASTEADQFKFTADIYVDPLLFNSTGFLIGSAEQPVHNAVKNYLKNLPFNGELSIDRLVDQIQQVSGVVFTQVTSAEHKYGDLDFTSVNAFVIPDSGYVRFENESDLQLTFKFRNPS